MQQPLRHYYLAQLGIDSYVPRKPLPGALVSGARVWEQTAEEAVAADGVSNSPPVAYTATVAQPLNSSVAQVRAVTDELLAKDRKRSLVSTTDAVARPPGGFNLNIWRVTDQLLVVDSRQPQSALPTAKLLTNILIALGYTGMTLPKSDVLQWPLDRAPGHSAAEGRAMLSAFYEAQFTKQPFDTVLLMGEQAVRYSLSDEIGAAPEPQTLYGQQISLKSFVPDQQAVKAILVPSLADMLRQPLLKKITWQAIQPLRRQEAIG